MVLRIRLLFPAGFAALVAAACSGSGFSGAVAGGEPTGDAGDGVDSGPPESDAGGGLTCKAARADCNKKASDGCEVDTSSNPKHCGACGLACKGGEVCAKGKCAASCPATLKNCSGACVDPAISVDHCGACDQPCAAPANGTATCLDSTCSADCNAGFETCATGCCPVEPPPPPPPVQPGASVATGASHSCAINAAGALRCWGGNTSGRLGDNTLLDRKTAVQVSGLTSGVIAVGTGTTHTCALVIGGEVKCWGANPIGQLGTGDAAAAKTPRTVNGIAGAVALGVGRDHACAILAGGSVKCWGANERGQLGDGTKSPTKDPVSVTSLTQPAVALALGGTHTCALLSDARVFCWGSNDDAQLGDGGRTERLQPTPVTALPTSVTAIAAGVAHSCALAGGKVFCWGSNEHGQLGDDSGLDSASPVEAASVADVAQVDAGAYHTCVVGADGGAKCWGLGMEGQLGDGIDQSSPTAITVSTLGPNGVLVKEIAGGAFHTCARTRADNVKCWGQNNRGQLGNGTTTPASMPVSVQGL